MYLAHVSRNARKPAHARKSKLTPTFCLNHNSTLCMRGVGSKSGRPRKIMFECLGRAWI